MQGLDDHMFPRSMLNVLLARQRFQTIIEPKSFFYLSLLGDLLGDPAFRMQFMRMEGWKQVGKEMGKIEGVMIDTQTTLGIFMRASVTGQRAGHYHQ